MRWLWGIVAGVIAGIVFAVVYRRNPCRQIKTELAAIEAARTAKQEMLTKGATITRRRIEAEHAETIRRFDEEQAKRLKEFRSDPAALARWLTRVSG